MSFSEQAQNEAFWTNERSHVYVRDVRQVWRFYSLTAFICAIGLLMSWSARANDACSAFRGHWSLDPSQSFAAQPPSEIEFLDFKLDLKETGLVPGIECHRGLDNYFAVSASASLLAIVDDARPDTFRLSYLDWRDVRYFRVK